MLFSFSMVFLVGFFLQWLFQHLHLPGILAMIITGCLLGPYVFGVLSPELLLISPDLREIALIVILLRAGLSLDLRDLKHVGTPAILMCCIPALFEITFVTLVAPLLFSISRLDAAIMGCVLAAVSPAVVVPRMLHLMETGYGKEKKIPQLIMAGASVDDIFVIVLFMAFMGMSQGETFHILSLCTVPISIIAGVIMGILGGWGMVVLFKRIHMRDTVKVLLIFGVSFIFVTLEIVLKSFFPVSGLIAVMALGCTILKQNEVVAKRLKGKFSKIWVAAEMILFVLVGAAVDITVVSTIGIVAVALVLLSLVFRTLGVHLSLTKTTYTWKEKLFCSIAYLPKATVQAAIGAYPLAMGLSSGSLILGVAVVAIFVTAPLGAIGIDHSYKKLLSIS